MRTVSRCVESETLKRVNKASCREHALLKQGVNERGSASSAVFSLILLLCGPGVVRAQEAVRMSLASAQAAEARRQASSTLGYYNIKMGPTGWRFGAGLGLPFYDNLKLSGTNSDSDFIFTPQINAQMLWPVTDKNRIDLSIGAGYSAYVQRSDLDRFYVTPGSELSFDLYIGDFWVNLHERLS